MPDIMTNEHRIFCAYCTVQCDMMSWCLTILNHGVLPQHGLGPVSYHTFPGNVDQYINKVINLMKWV